MHGLIWQITSELAEPSDIAVMRRHATFPNAVEVGDGARRCESDELFQSGCQAYRCASADLKPSAPCAIWRCTTR